MTSDYVAFARQRTRRASPYRINLLAGLLVAFLLTGVAVVLLAQLLMFPAGSSGGRISIFIDNRIVEIIGFTFFQAGLSTALSIIFGAIFAWGLAYRPIFRFRRILIAMISTALVLPTLVIVLGIVSVYGRAGWLAQAYSELIARPLPFSIYGIGGILLAHIFFNASFAARLFLHRLEAVGVQKHKLAFALGLSPWQKIRLIDFPAIRPALPGLALTIFLLCFTSFSIVLTLGGSPKYNTLEVAIYEAVKFDFDLPRAFTLALLQICICIALVFLASGRNLSTAPANGPHTLKDLQHLIPRSLTRLHNVIIVSFAIFFIAPIGAVVLDGLSARLLPVLIEPIFLRTFITSISIALCSAALALALSLLLSSAMVSISTRYRMNNNGLARLLMPFLSLCAMLYLVFPALVMGLGFFLLFQNIGGSTFWWLPAIVIFANATMALPFAVAVLHPSLSAIAHRSDRLCHSLGIGNLRRLSLINWPMIKGDVNYVLALAFCFSLGDLGVIALFGNEDFKTLPWLLYQKFGSYRTDDASVIALALLTIVMIVFLLAQKSQNTRRMQ